MAHEHKKNCLVILGMHRSGTSALAGVLNLLGVDFGKDLMAPFEGNSRGFFENNKITQINDEILKHFSSAWDDVVPLPVIGGNKNSYVHIKRKRFKFSGLNLMTTM